MAYTRFFVRPLIAHGVKITASLAGAGVAIAGKMHRDNERQFQKQLQKQAVLFNLRPFANRTKTQLESYEQTLNPHVKIVLMQAYNLNEEQIQFFLTDMKACNINFPSKTDTSIQSSIQACDWLHHFALSAQKLGSTSIHECDLKSLAREVVEKHDGVKQHYVEIYVEQLREAARLEWKGPGPF